jgi:predicted nucleic acid-binding protein
MSSAGPVVVADASVVINLNASECAGELLASLPFGVLVTDIVVAELTQDRRSGRRDADMLIALIRSGHIRTVQLAETGLAIFSDLVIGPASLTLDDGEAATIAYAAEHDIAPVIDERKGLKICRVRFPSLQPICTVDLFAHPAARNALGRDRLGEAIFLALQNARMRVDSDHIPWVIDQIGIDRAPLCPSLPKSARFR